MQNVTLDCPRALLRPTREAAIAVDPQDPHHIVVAAIDGSAGHQTIEFSTTFDDGKTWTIGLIPRGRFVENWDPWLSFDVKRGTVLLSFQITPVSHFCRTGNDQLVTISSDGGLSWGRPVVVLDTPGCNFRAPVFEEGKVSVDNNATSPYFGRSWITSNYQFCKGLNCSSSIGASHSDDGSRTWTEPRVISGSNPRYCTAKPSPPTCKSDLPPAMPAFGCDGSMHVTFANFQHQAAQEGREFGDVQLMVVNSPDGGRTWSPPEHLVDLETGDRDAPCFPTAYWGCVMNGTAVMPYFGDPLIAAAPTGALYVAFSDTRNGRDDVPHPVTNEDVFVMTSTDGGQVWTGPEVVDGARGDQFDPNIAVNPSTGELGILFYDRSADPHGHSMNVTLATGMPGSFQLTRITTSPSHLSHDLWLQQTLPGCPRCVWHIGEYLGLAFGSDGEAQMVWSDLRQRLTTPDGRTGYAENIDCASMGPPA